MRRGSGAVVRTTAVADNGERGSGNNLSQPPCHTITNTARIMLEQRQLSFLYTVVSRDNATVRYRRVNTATVDHPLAHKVNFGIVPCAAGSTTIRNSVRQIYPMFQNMTAKRTLDSGLSLFEICSVHCRTNITAIGRIGAVHRRNVQASVRRDNCMVGRTPRIAAVEIVVKSCNTVVNPTDSPVVTNIQILERTCSNGSILFWCNCISQEFTTVNRIMCTGIVNFYN